MKFSAKIFPWAKSGPSKKECNSKISRSYSDKSAENLNCPICLDEFEKPILVLPCQHSFCRKCIEGVVEFSNGGSEYDDYFTDEVFLRQRYQYYGSPWMRHTRDFHSAHWNICTESMARLNLCSSTDKSIKNVRRSLYCFFRSHRMRLWMIRLSCISRRGSDDNSMSSDEDIETYLKCPLCRGKVKLGAKGIDGLRRDVSLENMLKVRV